MTILESTVEINLPVEKIYTFLADMNNQKQLMPKNIENWTSTSEEAEFTFQNMATLSVKITERIENKALTASVTKKAPFNLTFKWELNSNGNTTTVKHIIHADLNAMMKMIATNPLQKFSDSQTQKLKEVLS